MFVQCLEQVQHYTCHILLFSSLLIKHHLHSMLCYSIISQGVTVAPLFPPRSALVPAASGMLQCCVGMGGAGGLLRNNAQDFTLHSCTALWKIKGKKQQMEGDPLSPHREQEHALGHVRESPANPILDVSARSLAQAVEGKPIPPNPAESDTIPPRDPTALGPQEK